MHVAFSLIDEETLKAKPVPFFKMRMKVLSRELENEFDLTRVKNHRDGRPIRGEKKTSSNRRRLGTDKDEIRNTIRACWDQSDCGRSCEGALAHEGMMLAQGDRRGLVVIDHAGGIHALGKRILNVNKSQILDRLADLDINELPSVQQAQSLVREMKAEHTQEPQEKKPPNWNRERAKTARQFVSPRHAFVRRRLDEGMGSDRRFCQP